MCVCVCARGRDVRAILFFLVMQCAQSIFAEVCMRVRMYTYKYIHMHTHRCIHELLKGGADVNIQDMSGYTPLDLAWTVKTHAYMNTRVIMEIVTVLQEAGAERCVCVYLFTYVLFMYVCVFIHV